MICINLVCQLQVKSSTVSCVQGTWQTGFWTSWWISAHCRLSPTNYLNVFLQQIIFVWFFSNKAQPPPMINKKSWGIVLMIIIESPCRHSNWKGCCCWHHSHNIMKRMCEWVGSHNIMKKLCPKKKLHAFHNIMKNLSWMTGCWHHTSSTCDLLRSTMTLRLKNHTCTRTF